MAASVNGGTGGVGAISKKTANDVGDKLTSTETAENVKTGDHPVLSKVMAGGATVFAAMGAVTGATGVGFPIALICGVVAAVLSGLASFVRN